MTSAQSANVTDLSLYLTNIPELMSNLNDNNSDFRVFYPTVSISQAVPKLSIHGFRILPIMKMLLFHLICLFFHCLLDTNKGFCWRSRYWLNSTQGARSHPVTDAGDLWDNGLVGMERTVGWMLLKLQHYWVISPFSLLEHKNEEHFWRKRTYKELGDVRSHHETLN